MRKVIKNQSLAGKDRAKSLNKFASQRKRNTFQRTTQMGKDCVNSHILHLTYPKNTSKETHCVSCITPLYPRQTIPSCVLYKSRHDPFSYLITHQHYSRLKCLFACGNCFVSAGSVPYFRLCLIALFSDSSSSMSPKTISKCSPSPSWSLMVKSRTGVLKMRISVMPAHVFRRTVVGGEFMARAGTSEIESQQLELMPRVPLQLTS